MHFAVSQLHIWNYLNVISDIPNVYDMSTKHILVKTVGNNTVTQTDVTLLAFFVGQTELFLTGV